MWTFHFCLWTNRSVWEEVWPQFSWLLSWFWAGLHSSSTLRSLQSPNWAVSWHFRCFSGISRFPWSSEWGPCRCCRPAGCSSLRFLWCALSSSWWSSRFSSSQPPHPGHWESSCTIYTASSCWYRPAFPPGARSPRIWLRKFIGPRILSSGSLPDISLALVSSCRPGPRVLWVCCLLPCHCAGKRRELLREWDPTSCSKQYEFYWPGPPGSCSCPSTWTIVPSSSHVLDQGCSWLQSVRTPISSCAEFDPFSSSLRPLRPETPLSMQPISLTPVPLWTPELSLSQSETQFFSAACSPYSYNLLASPIVNSKVVHSEGSMFPLLWARSLHSRRRRSGLRSLFEPIVGF